MHEHLRDLCAQLGTFFLLFKVQTCWVSFAAIFITVVSNAAYIISVYISLIIIGDYVLLYSISMVRSR